MNYSKPRANRSICWGDKLRSRGASFDFRPRQIFFRHLPSTEDAVFCFGKHKGENVKQVDDLDYMLWATGKLPLQPYQRTVLEQKITLDLKKILGNITEKPTTTNTKPKMSKLTFATAVLDTLCNFTAKKQPFSAYDVTRALRQRVNNGELTILEGTPTDFNGRQTTEILHWSRPAQGNTPAKEGVRDIVHDIFKQNDMTGYSAKDTGHYVLYTPDAAQPVNQSPLSAAIGVALSGLAQSLTSAVQQQTPAPSAPKSELAKAISNYVVNKGAPTLKQIQSAVKRKGHYTCQDIRDEALAIGLKVKTNTHLSKSTVSR